MSATSATPAGPTYVVVQGDAVRDRETVLALWASNLNAVRDRTGKFDWFYRDAGPWGATTFRLLWHEASATWVGVAAVGCRQLRYHGHIIRAGILADMALDARHRSLGPAMMLQMSLIESAAGRFDLFYGFPNRAAAVVMRRLGYTVIGQFRQCVFVLRHHMYLERHLPRFLALPFGWMLDVVWRMRGSGPQSRDTTLRAAWSETVDTRMDVLWEGSVDDDVLMAPRTTEMLRWRFDRFPCARTRYLLLSDVRDGELLAWFACESEGAYLHVRDFWSADAAHGVGRQYIAALIRIARDERYSAIRLEYASPRSRLVNWLALGFVEREHREVVCRVLDKEELQRLPPNYHFTRADEDV